MATALQVAANRRNAQRSKGPRTAEGKSIVRFNAVKHGMTAKVIVMPHECHLDYHEIRAMLVEGYAPATAQELMLVDQIAAGYWRTIRVRRFETAMFDNQLRTAKSAENKDTSPSSQDDEGCAVMLQVTKPESLQNYFRYDGTISRDYYKSIAALEQMQAIRNRREERTVARRKNPLEQAENTDFNSIGFVS